MTRLTITIAVESDADLEAALREILSDAKTEEFSPEGLAEVYGIGYTSGGWTVAVDCEELVA